MAKGAITLIGALAVLVLLVAGYYFATGSNIFGTPTTASIAPTTMSVTGPGAGATSGDLYSYSGNVYANFRFSDLVGTAVNPTCYFYEDSKSKSTSAFWGDERQFTDDSGTYQDSGTASSGKLQKMLVPGQVYDVHC